MQTITKEQQEKLQSKIKEAFNNGKGDFFMEKDNFSEIIVATQYTLHDFEAKGYRQFSLYSYERPQVEVEKEDTIDWGKEKFYSLITPKKRSYSQNRSYLDDYPEFYNNNEL